MSSLDLTKRMTSGEDFIKWVCEKAGFIVDTFESYWNGREYTKIIELDYNILMKAVENINKDKSIYMIEIGSNSWSVVYDYYNPLEHNLKYFSNAVDYDNSMLIALQHALLYIMENEND